ncbi:MAG: excinuclease ABC subunit UvrC [Alphaproteobacteria bacterium]
MQEKNSLPIDNLGYLDYSFAMQEKGADVIKKKIKTFSHRPGVYRMLDEEGTVLYVGKAKDLIHRLTNYTHIDRLSERIRQMVSKVADVLVIETAGETEAFLLENELIKQYHPYYNILLKDDKSYPYIALTKEEFPRLMKYRGNRKSGADYFGPFDAGESVNQTLAELQKLFGLRSCRDSYFKNRTRPCLMYQIKRCSGPCCGCISKEEYQKSVRETKDFLNGKSSDLQKNLQSQMKAFAENQEYEKAGLIRDKILALNHIQGTSQHAPTQDTDTVAVKIEGDTLVMQVFFHRTNRLTGHQEYVIHKVENKEETLSSLLIQLYEKIPAPQVICTSFLPETALDEALSKQAGHKVEISPPPFRALRRQWMEQTLEACERALHSQESQKKLWEETRELLGLSELTKIEVYDNSHIQGTNAVGAMIAATHEGFQKSLYRRFNIPSELAGDDFAMMQMVLRRRLQKGILQNNLPSALLIDGGKGQLSSVLAILKEFNLRRIAVLAISKGAGQHDKGLETFYLDTAPQTPIHLDFKSPLIHFLQRLRDEAHRFAIGSHRLKREKSFLHDSLYDIEGIGEKRRKELMVHFGSVKAVRGASLQQLEQVSGFSKKIAKKVYTFFHDESIIKGN